MRVRFNPTLNKSWFAAVMQVINNITMLSIVLTGAALIREREHGTVEHLLVMPVTPFEIMTSKVWAMALVVLVASSISLTAVVQGMLGVPIQGSLALFLAGTALHLFATTSMGIFLGTLERRADPIGDVQGAAVQRGRAGGKVALLAVGSVVPRKGYDVLVRALEIDAALFTEDDLLMLFSFARAYFMVDMEIPSAYVQFLRSLMPRKPRTTDPRGLRSRESTAQP